jgi:hypothetical protein
MRISKMLFRARLRLLPKQTHPLAKAALNGLRDARTTHEPHQCEKWARQVKERVYGAKFSAWQRHNAMMTAMAFKEAGYAVSLASGSKEGDLLYKIYGSGGDGHVGIRLAGNVVAENSSVHWDGSDARGLRTLAEFGNFDLIIRLSANPKNKGGEK